MDEKTDIFEQFVIKVYRFNPKKRKYKVMSRIYTLSFPTGTEIKRAIETFNGDYAEVAKAYWMPPFV